MPRVFVIGLAAACVAGCTLILPFDEIPPDAGGVDAALPDSAPDVARDAADDAGDSSAPPFPPPCDTTFPLAQVDCNGAKAPTCANRFATYPASGDHANDLVVCNASATATCVQHCPFGCALMPSGFPDQCDDCNGRADGFYCGRILRNWIAADFDLAVQCQGGSALKGAICGTNKCATPCPRTGAGEPKPSCCLP